ncbi:MAG: menaquinone biosynthetic enzyme MqnA/MqnD family protein [Candidatus Acidiferrales bacterium]
MVRYLNTAPLVWGLEHGRPRLRYRLSYTTPAACADDLRAGRAEVGIIPAIEYQRIPGLVLIPHLAVASQRKVESVLLISRGPARRAKRVALDTSSRTSAALVKILFAQHWRKEPEYIEAAPDLPEMLRQADAALLIGDPALRFLLHSPAAGAAGLNKEKNLHVYDLAEEWWRMTKLPFVFAVWAVRPEAVPAARDRRALVGDFLESRRQGLQNLQEIAHSAAARLQLPGGQLERYLRQSIAFELDDPARGGLESFFRYARELGLIEELRPLEFF